MRFLSLAALLLALLIHGPASAAAPLPYGPDTCKNGFVFREAYPDDHVCVTPGVRQRVAQDNATARDRVQPGGGAFGPDTCKTGWVWREARAQDHVCVSTQQRTQAANDNRLAYSRQQARLAEGAPKPPKARPPVEAVGPDGAPLGNKASIKECELGGARCPPRMKVAFDDNVGCVCRE